MVFGKIKEEDRLEFIYNHVATLNDEVGLLSRDVLWLRRLVTAIFVALVIGKFF